MKTRTRLLLAVLCLTVTGLRAEVPSVLSYQGRVSVGGVNFTGAGQFKFALVDAAGTTTFWSNDGTSVAGGAPTAAVTVAVNGGLYAVLLGDTTLANMTAVSPAVFANSHVRLRVWFNDGVNGFLLLTPDQRIAAVGYALVAATVADGALTADKFAPGSVGAESLTSTGVTAGSYTAATIAVDAQGRITSAASNSALFSRVATVEAAVADLDAAQGAFVTATALTGYAQTEADNAFTGANTFANAQGTFSGRIQLAANTDAASPANAGTLRYEGASGTLAISDGTSWRPLSTSGVRSTSGTVSHGGALSVVATDTPGSSPFPAVTVWVELSTSTVRIANADRNGSGDPAYFITYNRQTGMVSVTNNSGLTQVLHVTTLTQ